MSIISYLLLLIGRVVNISLNLFFKYFLKSPNYINVIIVGYYHFLELIYLNIHLVNYLLVYNIINLIIEHDVLM